MIRRREFVTLISGAVATWPVVARAQQPAMPLVGYVRSETFDETAQRLIVGFREGLKEAGYIEGHNVAIEFRSAQGRLDQLSSLVADLVRRPVAVIVGNVPAAKYAKAAESLLKPSSAARAVAAGAPFIERVDLLVKLISHQLGVPNAEIDRTVETVDQKLNEKIVQGGSGAT